MNAESRIARCSHAVWLVLPACLVACRPNPRLENPNGAAFDQAGFSVAIDGNVAIVGVPDRTWGEVGVAVCVLRQGAALSERELIAWMEDKVARYKLPKRIFFWEALPKSAYGKITKKDVRAELGARGCLPLDQPVQTRA